jgi:hypothetical protein
MLNGLSDESAPVNICFLIDCPGSSFVPVRVPATHCFVIVALKFKLNMLATCIPKEIPRGVYHGP